MLKKAKQEESRLWASGAFRDLFRNAIAQVRNGRNGVDVVTDKAPELVRIAYLASSVAEGVMLCEDTRVLAGKHQPHFDLLVEFIVNPEQGFVRRGKGTPKPNKVFKNLKLTSKRRIVFNMLELFPELAAPGMTPQKLLNELKERKVWRDAKQEYELLKSGAYVPKGPDPIQSDLAIVKEALFEFRRRIKQKAKLGETGR